MDAISYFLNDFEICTRSNEHLIHGISREIFRDICRFISMEIKPDRKALCI